ncbi:MAG: hypothetical protein ACRD0U_04075 [Acidimicrobiales bacterium]
MPVSDEDRRKMEILARDLREAETDNEPEGPARERQIELANRWRAERGIPPLKDEFEDPPEEEFYRIARARGLRRIRR